MSKGKWRIRIHTFFSFSSLKITRTISMNITFNFSNTRNVYTKGLKCRLSGSLMFRLHTSVEPYTVSVAQMLPRTEKAFTKSLKREIIFPIEHNSFIWQKNFVVKCFWVQVLSDQHDMQKMCYDVMLNCTHKIYLHYEIVYILHTSNSLTIKCFSFWQISVSILHTVNVQTAYNNLLIKIK